MFDWVKAMKGRNASTDSATLRELAGQDPRPSERVLVARRGARYGVGDDEASKSEYILDQLCGDDLVRAPSAMIRPSFMAQM